MFYQRILNIVPCAIQWDLLSIPIFNFNNGKILLHLPPPSFSLFSSGSVKSELFSPFSFSPTCHLAPKSCQSLFHEATPRSTVTPCHTSASAYSADPTSLPWPTAQANEGLIHFRWLCLHIVSLFKNLQHQRLWWPLDTPGTLSFPASYWCSCTCAHGVQALVRTTQSGSPFQGIPSPITRDWFPCDFILSQGHMCLFDLAYLDCTFLSFSLSFLM